MTRHHATSKGPIPFTKEEEIEADQREAEWIAGQAARDAAAEAAEVQRFAAIAAKEELALDQISKKTYAEIETYTRAAVTNLATAVDMMVRQNKLIKTLVDR